MNEKNLLPNILQILLLVFFLLLTVVIYFPIKNTIDTRLEAIKESAINQIEDFLGERIQYDSIAPSIFSFIEIRGFKIYDPEHDSVVLLSIDRLKIYYDIWNVFTGENEKVIREIGIEHTTLEFDLQRDQKLIDLYKSLLSNESGEEVFDIKNIDLVISGKNIDLTLKNEDGHINLTDLSFDVTLKPEGYVVALKGSVQAGLESPVFELSQCSASLDIKGSTDYTFTWADMTAKIRSFQSDLFSMEDQTFYLNYQNDTLEMRKIQDTLPVDISIQYLAVTNDLFVEFQAEQFRPSQLVSLRNDHPVYPWFSTRFNGSGGMRYNFETESMNYEFDGSVWIYNPFVPGQIALTSRLNGDTEHVNITSLYASTIYGNIYYSGNLIFDGLYPTGYIGLTDIQTPLDMPVSIGAYLSSKGGDIDIIGNKITIGETELADVQILFDPKDPLTALKRFSLTGGFALKGQESKHSISFKADIDMSQGLYVKTDLSTRNVSISKLYELAFPGNPYGLPLDTYGDRFYLTTKIKAETDLEQYKVETSTIITDLIEPINFVAFNADIKDNTISVNKYSAAWDIFRGEGNGSVSLFPGGIVHVKTDTVFQKTSYSLNILLMDSGNILFKGNYGLEGVLSGLGQRIGALRLRCEELPVPLNPDNPLYISVDADCLMNNNNLTFYLSDLGVKGSGIEYLEDNNLTASVNLGMDYCHLYKIHFQDSTSSLTGDGYVTFNLETLTEYKGWVQLFDTATGEEYNLGFYLNEDLLESNFSFNRSPLSRFGEELPVTGYLGGSGVLNGTISDLDFDLTALLSLQDGYYNDEPLVLDLKTHVNRKKIALSDVNCVYNEIHFRDFGVEYAIDTGGAGITGTIEGENNDKPYSVNIFLALIMKRGEDITEIEDIVAAGFNGYISLTDIVLTGLDFDFEDVSFQFRHFKGITSFEGGPDDIFSGLYHNTGEFFLAVKDPMPVQLNVSGKIEDGNIEAELNDITFDMAEIWSFVEMPFITFTKGTAFGNIKIYGNMNDPDFDGILTIKNAGMNTPFVKNEIETFNARFFFKEKEIRLDEINFENDVTSFRADGFIHIDHWLPSEYKITVDALKPKGVQVDYDFPGVAVDGLATGKLEFIGSLTGITIKGDVLAETGLVTFSENKPSDDGEKSEFAFVLDLMVETGKNVEFLGLELLGVPIMRAYTQSGNNVHIYNNSLEEHYTIIGEVVLKAGEVDLQFSKFIIKEGSVIFDEDETEFNPIIKLRAERKVRDNEGEVIVFVVVDGPFKNFSDPRLESVPPRSTEEIWALLGVTTDFTLENVSSEMDEFTAGVIALTAEAAGFGTKWALNNLLKIEQSIQEALGLDFVYFETELVERFVRSFSETDPQNYFQNVDITDYLENTRISGGRYLSDQLFFAGEIGTIKATSSTTTANNVVDGSLGLQTSFGVELKTPLFLVEPTINLNFWDVTNIENFWTLSLTQRISY